MTEIDVIMGMRDWNNSAEEQAAGLAQAAQVENFQVFLQPCTEHYNKNVWDNCAKALAMRSDAELDACLENLLAWLRDMNWPGAFLILERLQAFQNSAALHRAIAESLLCAQALGDETDAAERLEQHPQPFGTEHKGRLAAGVQDKGGPTCAKLIWNWIIVPNANRKKHRTHFPHRVSSSFTCFQWP